MTEHHIIDSDIVIGCNSHAKYVFKWAYDVIKCLFASSNFLLVFAVMAAASIANIVKSSLGPVGLDKMLVDDIGVCFSLQIIYFFITHCGMGSSPCLMYMLTGRDHHQRWSHHPEAAGSGAPSCQGPV